MANFPRKREKKEKRQERALVFLVRDAGGSYLVSKRQDTGLLAGLLEFPTVDICECTSHKNGKGTDYIFGGL